jgi:hypothetical protein
MIVHGFDDLINEHWTEELDAFLIAENIVVKFYDRELAVYIYPNSLTGKSSVDYWPVNANVKRFTIYFEGFTNWHEFDLSQPFGDVLAKLAEK